MRFDENFASILPPKIAKTSIVNILMTTLFSNLIYSNDQFKFLAMKRRFGQFLLIKFAKSSNGLSFSWSCFFTSFIAFPLVASDRNLNHHPYLHTNDFLAKSNSTLGRDHSNHTRVLWYYQLNNTKFILNIVLSTCYPFSNWKIL